MIVEQVVWTATGRGAFLKNNSHYLKSPAAKLASARENVASFIISPISVLVCSNTCTINIHVHLGLTNYTPCLLSWGMSMGSIPYSGKLSSEKTFTNLWNIRFREENFRGFATDRMLCAINQSGPHPFSWRKLSRMASDPRNSWKFSPSKVSHYTVTAWFNCPTSVKA